MKVLNYAVLFSTCLLVQNQVIALSLEPFLSTPGNYSILVFLDLHRSYHDRTCTVPDWKVFELAQILRWKSLQENLIGIEIYDTCSSQRRVQDIIRQRLVPENCLTQALPQISGIISQSSQAINDIIVNSFDSVHVAIGNEVANEEAYGKFHIELASKHSVEMLAQVLRSLNWTYVTTISDSHPQTKLLNEMFTGIAFDVDICIQNSQLSTDLLMDGDFKPKTNGVVIFANDIDNLKDIMQKLPKFLPVVIATHDRRNKLNFVHQGIVLSDAFLFNEQFTDYMTSNLWNQTALDELSIEYYFSNHNCSFKNSSAAGFISCDNIKEMKVYFSNVSSSRQFHLYQEAFTFITNIGHEIMVQNCTNFSTNCLHEVDINKMSTYFKVGDNQTLVPRLPYNASITLIEGSVEKSDVFSTTDLTEVTSYVSSFLGSDTFPSSKCTEWCPSCQKSTCSMHSPTLEFKGDYFYVPGDVLITGMLPLSQRWDKMSTGKVCSGMRLESNFDILSEAFLFAVLSAHDRFPDVLQNVKIGALLLDTCGDSDRASQILLNFESCMYNFETEGNNWKPSPATAPAYVVVGSDEKFMGESKAVGKLALGVKYQGDLYRNDKKLFDSSSFNFEILANFLHTMNLSYVGLVTSFTSDNVNINNLFETAKSRNICIAYNKEISTQNTDLLDDIRKSTANVVIVFATSSDTIHFFKLLTTRSVIKTWILIETRENWLDTSAFPLPPGAVIFSPYGKQNSKFNLHMNNLINKQQNNITTNNPWIERYKQARSEESIQIKPFNTNITTRMQASDVIRSVDIVLEAISHALEAVCGNKTNGILCPEFAPTGGQEVLRALDQLWYMKKSTEPFYASNLKYQRYVIKNLQQDGLVEVGGWNEMGLALESTKLRSYDSKFNQLPEFRKSFCFVTPCSCANINITANKTETAKITRLDYEMGFVNSSAQFQKDLWVLIVVIISGTGSLLTLLLMIYIMCKVCAGALVRRYLALGILLLVAMILLFLSVLPFLFSPSESVCGMRYFAHGFSYAFCFGIILTKMMTLRNYKYIGLGGEISRINQLLTVFFITAVQVAIGIQWWVLRTPVVFSELVLEAGENDSLRETTYYACDFVRKDFVAYHSYVIFLLVLCCFYSLSVRKETKNMKEARLLLICTWFCLVLWIGIIVTIMVLDRKYLEAICAIGILGNALSMVVFIYLPKLTAISRLKYEISEQNAHKENGYKLDPDFQFERPYSLPGTLHSSITDKALTYPRSLATFDTSLSY